MFEAFFMIFISNDSTTSGNIKRNVEVKTKSAIAPEPKIKTTVKKKTKLEKKNVPKHDSEVKTDPNLKIWILTAALLIPWLIFSTFFMYNLIFINIIIIISVTIVLSGIKPIFVKKTLIFVTLFYILIIIIPKQIIYEYYDKYYNEYIYEYYYEFFYPELNTFIIIMFLICNILIAGYLCKRQIKKIQVKTEKIT